MKAAATRASMCMRERENMLNLQHVGIILRRNVTISEKRTSDNLPPMSQSTSVSRSMSKSSGVVALTRDSRPLCIASCFSILTRISTTTTLQQQQPSSCAPRPNHSDLVHPSAWQSITQRFVGTPVGSMGKVPLVGIGHSPGRQRDKEPVKLKQCHWIYTY